MLDIGKLPQDDGFLPAGMWHVALRDNLTDALAGAVFRNGLTVHPVNGRLLKRIVTFMGVVGALRVEGTPCALGDCSRLLPAKSEMPAVAAEEPPMVAAPAPIAAKPSGKRR
jgi:hypothetical protein